MEMRIYFWEHKCGHYERRIVQEKFNNFVNVVQLDFFFCTTRLFFIFEKFQNSYKICGYSFFAHCPDLALKVSVSEKPEETLNQSKISIQPATCSTLSITSPLWC